LKSNNCLKISERVVVKPTYRVVEDKIPYFGSRHYPYTKLNIFENKPTPTQYREIAVENDFLEVAFRPDIGSRIFSAFDKIFGDHIFNCIDLIRPTLIACRGAWIAAGLEFNLCPFPSHTVDNFSPVDYIVKRERDCASIVFGSLNLISNVEYAVIVRLKAGSSRIETEIRTFNTSLIPERYYFWSNAALPASQGLRIFYPGHHSNIGIYPINEQGIDLSWYRNYIRPTSLFILDSEEDFFAAYNYDRGIGVVHVADHNLVPGKKFWTWGVSEDGLFWKDLLSDKGIPYIEIQSGRFLTQGIVELIDPLRFESWTEFWYPVRGLNGLVFANENAAINIERIDEEKARITIASTIACENAKLEVLDLEENLKIYEETVDLSPSFTVAREVTIKARKPMLRVLSPLGDEIISWDFREYRTNPPETPAWRDESEDWGWKDSAEELWLKGVDSFKREHHEIAKRFFQRSLEKDSSFSKSITWLGLLSYISGLYEDAEILLKKSLRRNPYDEEARYYLCLTLMSLNKNREAERNLWKLYNFGKNRSLIFYLLGILRLRSSLYRDAEEMFRRALVENGLNLRALTTLSAVLRRRGRKGEAAGASQKGYELMPLDYMVLSERYLTSLDEESERTLYTGYQKVLEAAKEYIFAGLFDDAITILKGALNHGIKNPLIYYYLGYAFKRLGQLEEAIKCYESGEKEDFERIFPHRLLDIDVLRDVVDSLQKCQVAHYLLGNVLFYRGRWSEALKEWEKALQNGLKNSVLYRNIGFSYSILTDRWDKAIEAYREAIRVEPKNQTFYIELDDIYSRIGLFDERVDLLEKAPAEAKRYALIARLCSAYIDVGREDKALNMLLNTFFEPSEGYYGFWEIYVDALLAIGLKSLRENKVKESLQYFNEATKYPRSLGVGAPQQEYRRDVIQMYCIGLAYETLGDRESAERVWNEALQRKVDLVSEHKVFQALILRKLGRNDEAKALLDKIVSEAHSRIKEGIEKVGDVKSPVARLLFYDDSIAYMYYVIGIAKMACGDHAEGLEEINKALSITKSIRHARWIKEGTLII